MRIRLPVRIAVVLVALCLALTALLAVAKWPGRLYLDSDYIQYYAGSHALLEGASPYDHDWWNDFYGRVGSRGTTGQLRTGDPAIDWTTPYPLPTFVALLPFALLPLDLAEPLFATAQVALLLGAVLALAALVCAHPRRDAALLLALVAASQPLWLLVAGGNATGYATASFTFSLAALLSGRPGLAGLLLVGVIVKPHLFVIAVPALLVGAPARQRLPFATGAALGAFMLIAPAFALQPTWVGDWLREAGRLQSSSFSNATGWTLARSFTDDFVLPSALLVATSVAALAAWWRIARPDLVRLVAASLPVSVFAAPHGWSYDYIALLPTLVVGIALASAAKARALVLAGLAVLTVAAPWALYIVASRRNSEDLSALLLVAVEILLIMIPPQSSDGRM